MANEEDGERTMLSKVRALIEDTRVKATDKIVSIIANRDVDTSPRPPPRSSDAASAASTPPMPRGQQPTTTQKPEPEPPSPEPIQEEEEAVVVAEAAEEEASKPEPDYGIFADLPRRYAGHRIALIARDPRWAFAYWDVDPQRAPALFEGGMEAVLRLVDANDGHLVQSPRVDPEGGTYYFRLPAADQRYYVALMAVRGDIEHEVLRSNIILAPPALPRPEREPRFVRLDAQKEVLAQAEQTAEPPALVCHDARRLATYHTPSIAGQTLTLLPKHEKPHAPPVETTTPSHPESITVDEREGVEVRVRAIHSGSESVYVTDVRSLSSRELVRR